jgi:hypothetical protein
MGHGKDEDQRIVHDVVIEDVAVHESMDTSV